MDASRNFIESLARGLSILTLLAERANPLSLTELSGELGLSISTMQRFTYTLQKLGYLERNQENKKFRLTSKVLSLGSLFLSGSDLAEMAFPYLQELSKETGETVNLCILDGTEIVYLQRIPTLHLLRSGIRLGSRYPAHCTSVGKTMLAFLPMDRLEDILQRMDLQPFTPKTITNKQDLLKELNKIRARGFGICNEELSLGVRAVAAPIRNHEGEVVAGVNIGIPTARCSMKNWENFFGKKVTETAARISSAMGFKEIKSGDFKGQARSKDGERVGIRGLIPGSSIG
jgi:IclR family pca regulon transcriptional regulator